MRVEDVAKLLRTIEAVQIRAGVAVTAVYVDTVSRTLPGADENLQKDMTLFVAACDQVRVQFHATVVGVHHTSRANGTLRGSTVFDGAGDFLLQIERDEGAKTGTMTARKIKAAEDGWVETFALPKIELSLGHTSLVAVKTDPLDPEPVPASDLWPDKQVCRDILAAIAKAWNAGMPWSSKPQTAKEGRYGKALMKERFNVAEDLAGEMIQKWLNTGVLSYEMVDARMKRYGLKVVGWID